MKKLLIRVFVITILVTLTNQMNANCTGTSPDVPLAICGASEVGQAYSEAYNNCCSGSTIYFWDYCNGVTGSWFVHSDGPNAGCQPV